MGDEWSKLKGILRAFVEAASCECVGIDIADARPGKVVRVYIDTPDGVGHTQCEAVSRAIITYFDQCEEDGAPCFSGKYLVEVSSPGIERPLFTKEHYARFIGRQVAVQTRAKKRMTGEITACDDAGNIDLLVEDGGAVTLNLDDIKRANLVYVMEKGVKKGGTGSKKKSKGK